MQPHIFPLCTPQIKHQQTHACRAGAHLTHMCTGPLARTHADKAESREQAHRHFVGTLRLAHHRDTHAPVPGGSGTLVNAHKTPGHRAPASSTLTALPHLLPRPKPSWHPCQSLLHPAPPKNHEQARPKVAGQQAGPRGWEESNPGPHQILPPATPEFLQPSHQHTANGGPICGCPAGGGVGVG